MGIRYSAFLQVGHGASTALHVDTFRMTEQYNSGWNGYAILTAFSESDPLGIGTMFHTSLAAGVRPGSVATLLLAYASQTDDGETVDPPESAGSGPVEGADPATADGDDELRGWIVRAWPCVVASIEPFKSHHTDALRVAHCVVQLRDPVSYLASRPIWGAYRGCSPAAMIGGALSMAAGGDGKPTLAPVLPGLPILDIAESVRDDIKVLPYSIASGQPLGRWLGEVTGLLGLRMEMLGNAEGRIRLTLTDQPSRGTPMDMTVSEVATDSAEAPGAAALHLNAVAAHPPAIRRGGMLDDVTLGSFRYLDRLGPVGNVQTGAEIGVEEAVRRVHIEREAVKAEMVMLRAETGQPGNRPGRLVRLEQAFMGVDTWQLARVVHVISGSVYSNQSVLLPDAATWHPRPPSVQPLRFVSGIVDGGDEAVFHEPVPRDRLGRIPVALAFTPTPMGVEAVDLMFADTNQDMRVTLADFTDDEVRGYKDDAESWEEEERLFMEGEYDDPHPDRSDDELTEEEMAERKRLDEKRTGALKYMAYKRAAQRAEQLAEQDRDSDSYVTARDALISDPLKALMDDPATRADLDAWSSSYREGGLEALQRDFPDDYQNCLANLREIIEYGALFHGDSGPALPDDAEGLPDNLEERHRAGELSSEELAFREADVADERWPPRLPLAVIAPMAGSLHGFIHGHRQGDICRIAIHNPLYAEVAGFQYRSNRQINDDIVGATAGLVVEHNLGEAWSGVVFQPAQDIENAEAGGVMAEVVETASNGSGG